MAIATRVVRDGEMSATGALIVMAAECGCAAAFDGLQHLQMMPGNPTVAMVDEGLSIIHVQGGKGRKDRDFMLSPKLLAALREY